MSSASPELEKGMHGLTCTSSLFHFTWAAKIVKGFAVDPHPLHNRSMSKLVWGYSVFAALHP